MILITIDTLRADHVGYSGNRDVQTPNIDELAKKGLVFHEVYTPVPITLPAHASLFTGNYPPEHGVRDNGHFSLRPENKTIAEIFKNRGYQTGAVTGPYVLHRKFGLSQGFEFYEDNFEQKKKLTTSYAERDAGSVNEIVFRYLKKRKKEPFFSGSIIMTHMRHIIHT